MKEAPAVLIVGAGPAGLAAAAELGRLGLDDVLVLEREDEAGGIPRFCPHPTFGLTDFFRPLSGPAYAARWRERVRRDQIATGTTVTQIEDDATVRATDAEGERTLRPKRILLATGIRERSRAARLVSGDRPRNVLTTGALQRLVAAGGRLPFSRPVVVGSELVSFSAVLTLREHGARPVAMLEAGPRIVAMRPGDIIARTVLQTPVLCGHRLVSINARANDATLLASVTVETATGRRDIECDAVIFTGCFVPEASLLGNSGLLATGSRGPRVDQHWRTDNPLVYAAGNVLRSVETAAWSAREGAAAAQAIAADLTGRTFGRRIPIELSGPVRAIVPGALSLPVGQLGPLQMQIRMDSDARGRFSLRADGTEFWTSRRMTARRERRYGLTRVLPPLDRTQRLTLAFVEE
jgi:NADPH-dependent 2,4-dienoyl-CoA reductase/sulfur reductase-like enzyme